MAGNRRGRGRAAERPHSNVAPAGLSGGTYRPLREGDVPRIVAAAVEVLERTGIEVAPSPCREVFRAAGCRIDDDANRVYIGQKLIESGLQTAAREVLLAGRSPAHDLKLGGQRVYMGTGGQAVKILDLDGEVRETRLSDNYDIGRLCDTLEHIHFYMRPVVPRDLPNEQIDLNQFYACLAATEKHVMANAYLPEKVAEQRAMAEILAGGAEALDRRPIISYSNCWTVSPLRYATETVEILDQIVAQGLPVAISSAPQAGATSPAALAGTLVQIIAEQLSGIVYVNLLSPGHPLLMGCVPAQADLRSGAFVGGSSEFALLNAACAQIAQYLDVPIYNSSGISDAKVPDAQAGAEKGITGLAAALAGSNYIHHSAGFLESLLTVAYEQFVIDNDVNGEIMRMLKGIEVTEESLSIPVIDEVCKGVGHFLGHPQTLALMNSEYLYPSLLDRDNRDDWEMKGARDIREAAREQARKVLAEHWPQAIPADLDAEIRRRFEIVLPERAMRPAA
ncbi:trimethylamine methyltransferase [Pelagibius litoralis]|uniref:Methyltransferase n=1 Tax=Pelagibius litoralis TaxID=374515 RepID=A0A967EWY4_9PROT|nr:trimethylamine methyltransferase family protein [Pelagibius litoralis]NIA68943.1 trimethylamine methyltransferase [Pelagibius litoralis]